MPASERLACRGPNHHRQIGMSVEYPFGALKVLSIFKTDALRQDDDLAMFVSGNDVLAECLMGRPKIPKTAAAAQENGTSRSVFLKYFRVERVGAGRVNDLRLDTLCQP